MLPVVNLRKFFNITLSACYKYCWKKLFNLLFPLLNKMTFYRFSWLISFYPIVNIDNSLGRIHLASNLNYNEW